jgi:hypothetical protein
LQARWQRIFSFSLNSDEATACPHHLQKVLLLVFGEQTRCTGVWVHDIGDRRFATHHTVER